MEFLLENLFRSVPRPDVSVIGWGVIDWYQRHNYRELGKTRPSPGRCLRNDLVYSLSTNRLTCANLVGVLYELTCYSRSHTLNAITARYFSKMNE